MISIELVSVGAGVVLGFLLLAKLLALMVWAEAKAVDLPLSFLDVVRMRIRGTDPASVIRPAVIAKAAGHPVDVRFLEAHSLAGGNPHLLVRGFIYSKKVDLDVSVDDLAAADLTGTDPVEFVERRARGWS